MAIAEPLNVYRCDKCGTSYTKKQWEKLKKTRKGRRCDKCRGYAKKIEPLPEGGITLSFTEPQGSVEKFYYRMLEELRERKYKAEKIKDVYTASEASSFWENMERRKQFQAEQAMKYIANIGSMMKSLFQMLRELRMIDQRLDHYKGREKGNKEDDIALKGIWIDKVEGGAQKPSSIYGMATKLGFTTLPDLFFDAFPKKREDISKIMKSMKANGVNRKIREVLQRKLAEFMTWMNNTKRELEDGKKFKMQYLRQHFHVIRMYLRWVEPYIKNVENLNILAEGGKADVRTKTDLIRAAESAVIDIELFATKESTYYHPCVRIVFHFQSSPNLEFRKGYQRGPAHVGKTTIEFYGYPMTDNDIKAYRHQKIDEDIELLKSVFSAMEALEDELKKYLKAADDDYAEKLSSEDEEEEKKGNFIIEWVKRRRKRKKEMPNKYERKTLLAKTKAKLYKRGRFPSGIVWTLHNKFKKYFGAIRW